jgi:indole-3-glycerol phosphate synthase
MAQNQKAELLKGLYENSLEQSMRLRETITSKELQGLAGDKTPIDPKPFFQSDELSVIAEIKRASPSKGHLAEIEDPLALAKTYEFAGAAAISVLTEQSGFSGSIRDLEIVSGGVSVPTLRKDFISIKEQILEAKAFGASMVLLIMLGLDDEKYKELFEYAKEHGLEVLVETHSESEIERALKQPVSFLGINTRNLNTFETDIHLFGNLVSKLPEGVIKVAESAVGGVEDARLYRQFGADAVLVGEALVKGDAKSLIKSFRSIDK